MNFQDQTELFGITLVVVLTLDYIWLKLLMRRFYVSQLFGIAQVTGSKIVLNWRAIVPVSFLLTLGLHFFVMPMIHHGFATSFDLYVRPALFGLIIYGIHQWTNRCLIPGWSLKLAIVDTIWGMTFFVLATNGVRWLAQMMKVI